MRESTDRICHLPDSIIHLIFSFLDTREVVQTGILSNSWRQLWASCPYLSFEIEADNEDSELLRSELNDFIEFVNRVLLVRDASNIQKFTLTCEAKLNAKYISTLVIAALKRRIQELRFFVIADEPIEMPYSLFTSDVKEVTFGGFYCGEHGFRIHMPISMCSAANMLTLNLCNVKLPDGDSTGGLILNFAVMEKLFILQCDISHLKMLTISALQLKRLDICQRMDAEDVCKIKMSICCPNLKSLYWNSSTDWDCCLGNLANLNTATVWLWVDGDFEPHKKLFEQYSMKLLKEIYNVKSLVLSTHVFESVTGSSDLIQMLQSIFHNLRDIKLVEADDDIFMIPFSKVANLLMTLDGIESFCLERDEETVWNLAEKGDELGEELAVHCQFDSLKKLEIRNLHGKEDELKFLEFIFKRAAALTEVYITTDTTKKMKKFREKLSKLPRASSSVIISFPPSVKYC